MKLDFNSIENIINLLLKNKENIKSKKDWTYLIIFITNLFFNKIIVKYDIENFWLFIKKFTLKYLNEKIEFIWNKNFEIKYKIYFLIKLLLLDFDLPQFIRLLIDKKVIREEYLSLIDKLLIIINDISLQIPSLEICFKFFNDFKKKNSSDKMDNLNIYSENKFNDLNSFFTYYENYFDILSKRIFKTQKNLKSNLYLQMKKCYSCNISLKHFIFFKNYDFCNYTNKYYCKNCMFDEKLRIPIKIIKNSDINKYRVSKIGEYDLKRFNKVIAIEIRNINLLANNYKQFFLYFLLKNQIRIQFFLICDFKKLIKNLPNRENIFLKRNYFNLQDIEDILDLSLVKLLNQTYYNIFNHFLNCIKCKKKGIKCDICNTNNLIFEFDIENITKCQNCKNIFHKKCSKEELCFNCFKFLKK